MAPSACRKRRRINRPDQSVEGYLFSELFSPFQGHSEIDETCLESSLLARTCLAAHAYPRLEC